MMFRAWSALILASSAQAHSLAAQRTVVRLDTPVAVAAEPFGEIAGVRELPNGRVLVSDVLDRGLFLVDFAQGRVQRVGREGRGPREYVTPTSLVPLPDGETILVDVGAGRFLVVDPNGDIRTAVTPIRVSATGLGGFEIELPLFNLRGADDVGRLYFQGPAVPGAGGAMPDSVPVLRWLPPGNLVDTAAWAPTTGRSRTHVTESGDGGLTLTRGAPQAWPARAAWGVAPDGRIAVVTPRPYRLTWWGPNGPLVGPSVAFRPIAVTDADKEAYRRDLARRSPATAFGGAGDGRLGLPPRRAPEPEWPETMPPFSGARPVHVAPDGDVWVARTHSARNPTPRYDVFDASGALTAEVLLEPNRRIVGFGPRSVYVAWRDNDDLEHLERYAR